MEEQADPPRKAHKKNATSVGTASSNTSESLRARQLDRLASRSKPPARLPLSVSAKGKGRDTTITSGQTTAVENSKLTNSSTSPRKAANASKLTTGLKRDGTLSSAAAKRLNNRTLGSEKGTMHSRGKGSSGENKLMDDTLASGKEGRSFTVGKVGGGGKIYLRPSTRPPHHLYQQPNFQFSTRPSTKNGPNASLLADNEGDDDQRDSILSYQSRSTTPFREHTSTLKPSQHARAYSHSTIDEHAVQDWDVGAFKVVIDRPSADGRPKTSGGTHSSFPTLEVPIPSYKIGTPRFSVRGTPFIRGSSYAPTEADNRTSIISKSQRESSFMGLKRDSRSFHPANPFRHSVASSLPADQASVFELRLPPTGLTGQTPNLMPRQAIVPEMFDSISTLPMCEDRSVVRRNLAGQISAATPARLIVEVTKELNYDLVASVFITYRSYITASDLLSLVMARLQHGINQGDQGLVVTVRCFTVIRHWLVNFFIDDYVLDYNLRVEFCELVNHMVQRHAERMTNRKTTNDILSNIKRLWRDSCSTYWDGPEFDVDSDALVPIYPGGVAGSRDPKLTPETFVNILRSRTPRSDMGDMSVLSRPPILELDLDKSMDTSTQRFFSSVPIEQSRQQVGSSKKSGSTTRGHRSRPSIPERPMSPRSIASVDAFSCSFPLKAGQLASAVGVGAHPVSTVASSVAASSPTVRAPKPMRSNSQRGPRRNRSVSNSSRPERPFSADPGSPGTEEHELYFTDRFAGSLIRGLVFLPPPDLYLPAEGPPISKPSSVADKRDSSNKHEQHQSGSNGKGMKKMFGTVRRAVNKSESGDKPQHLSHPHLSIALEQTAAIGCAAGAAVVKQCFGGQSVEVRMRPDKLSQFVERDFEAIVEQHRAALEDAEHRGDGEDAQSYAMGQEQRLSTIKGSSPEQLPDLGPISQSRDGSPKFESFPAFEANGRSGDNVLPSLSQPLPGSGLMESSWQASSAPTPPVTPPDRIQGTSQHLGEYGASTTSRTPSLVLGLRSPASLDSQPSFRPLRHPSAAQRERKGSSSASIRRIASFHSGYTREIAERSFDATTFSAERTSMGSTHAPGNRVLRRRPGGDLRAVQRVNDLPLRRYRSTSSLSTYDASLRSSFRLGGNESAGHLNVTSAQEHSRPFSVGALADPDGTSKPTKPLSLYSTDSKPVMRPSFQAEAAKLAEIPDDVDDDGGVESALLKLEGKYEQRRSQTSNQELTEDFSRSSEIDFERMFDQPSEDSTETGKNLPTLSQELDTSSMNIKETSSELEAYIDDVTPTGGARAASSVQNSMYNEIPLLQRDSTFSIYATKPLDRTQYSFDEPSSQRPDQSHINYNRSQESIDIANKTDSMNSIRPEETLPRHSSNKGSYIEVEHNGDHSDLSSEMSMEMLSSQDFSTSAFLNKPSPYTQQRQPSTELQIPASKASQNSGLTMQHALGLLPSRDTYPPTPQGTPTIPPPRGQPAMQSWCSGNQPQATERPTVDQRLHADGGQIVDDHYPFILSFPATLLAEQFTLVEMEALSEIHFRELLEMKWSHDAASSCRSWPKFLQKLSKVEEDDSVSHGIEICAARSSIMTSWACSEVVLTTRLEERAKTVAKYIHIANECRKLGNYATLFQLTVALTNPVLTELHQTWAQVSAADIALLRDFEALICPANNFRRLRDEMESVLDKRACIPLVAIYAKDLSALKDMPSYIASTLSEPPLINITKCKAQAVVVQLVARYLEKSGELKIRPVQEVVARCLWVGGLRDAEVKECARGLV